MMSSHRDACCFRGEGSACVAWANASSDIFYSIFILFYFRKKWGKIMQRPLNPSLSVCPLSARVLRRFRVKGSSWVCIHLSLQPGWMEETPPHWLCLFYCATGVMLGRLCRHTAKCSTFVFLVIFFNPPTTAWHCNYITVCASGMPSGINSTIKINCCTSEKLFYDVNHKCDFWGANQLSGRNAGVFTVLGWKGYSVLRSDNSSRCPPAFALREATAEPLSKT